MPKLKDKSIDPDKHTTSTTEILNGSVYMEKSVTTNLGDFNSAKVTVGITLPLDFTDDHLDAAKVVIKRINKVLDAEIEKQVDALEL